MPRKICIVTGTRAEYGLLYWVMKEIQQDPDLELMIIATGMHLSPEFGLTWHVIEEEGFLIDARVEMLLSSDTPVGIAKSIGLGVIGFADALERLQPDILLMLGDRFEIFAAAQAALVARIPLAHIAGGDVTEGAFDEAIRHSITKMAHLHFVTNEQSALRVKQLGECPEHIFTVGNPGLDHLNRLTLLTREELEQTLSFRFRARNLLVTFHPVTLELQSASVQFRELLAAFERLGPEVGLIFTMPNADTDGRILMEMISDFVTKHANATAHKSLGQLRYLSALSHVDAVVGNSSSGLYEAPSFKKPTVNIGDRQKGRLQAISIINCVPEATVIAAAIKAAFALDCSNTINPYGDGESSSRIVSVLKRIGAPTSLLKKRFHEVEF
jgi:UDP-N-acetylglucosamine 2-epimerase (non-hydrolysing)/GDP/UDP-N,N'-diacetylbacillosamine 2-epimerase (hydrolysing)